MARLSPDAIEFLRDVSAPVRKVTLLAAMFDHPKQREAAKSVGLRQDKASELLSQFEDQLGVDLAEMQGNRKVPNATAEMLRPELEAFTDALNALSRSLMAVRSGRRGSIRLSCYNPALKLFLADAIGSFAGQQGNEGYEIQLPTNMTDRRVDGVELLDDLRNGKLDYVVIPRPLDRSAPAIDDLECRVLYRWNVVAVMDDKHRLRSRAQVTPQDLAQERLLLSPQGFVSRLEVESGFALTRIRARVVLDNADTLTRIALAKNGYGVALAPTDTLEGVPSPPWPVFTAGGSPLTGEYVLLWVPQGPISRLPAEVHDRFVATVEEQSAEFGASRGLNAI